MHNKCMQRIYQTWCCCLFLTKEKKSGFLEEKKRQKEILLPLILLVLPFGISCACSYCTVLCKDWTLWSITTGVNYRLFFTRNINHRQFAISNISCFKLSKCKNTNGFSSRSLMISRWAVHVSWLMKRPVREQPSRLSDFGKDNYKNLDFEACNMIASANVHVSYTWDKFHCSYILCNWHNLKYRLMLLTIWTWKP